MTEAAAPTRTDKVRTDDTDDADELVVAETILLDYFRLLDPCERRGAVKGLRALVDRSGAITDAPEEGVATGEQGTDTPEESELLALFRGMSPDVRNGFMDGLRRRLGPGESEGSGDTPTLDAKEADRREATGRAYQAADSARCMVEAVFDHPDVEDDHAQRFGKALHELIDKRMPELEGEGNGDPADTDETPEPDWQSMATEVLGEEGRGARLCNLWMSGWKDGSSEEPDYIAERLWLSPEDAEIVVKGILKVLRPYASHRGDDWPNP